MINGGIINIRINLDIFQNFFHATADAIYRTVIVILAHLTLSCRGSGLKYQTNAVCKV